VCKLKQLPSLGGAHLCLSLIKIITTSLDHKQGKQGLLWLLQAKAKREGKVKIKIKTIATKGVITFIDVELTPGDFSTLFFVFLGSYIW
jgi:hypothetical protein